MTSRILSGSRLDIRLEGAVAEAEVPLAKSAAALNIVLADRE